MAAVSPRGQRRKSLIATSENADSAAKEASELNYVKQVEMAKGAIEKHMEATEEKLTALLPAGLKDLDASTIKGGMHGVVEWIQRVLNEEADLLSQNHRSAAREALKAQAAVFEMKLATSRTAAAVQMEAKAVELQADLNRKLEDTTAALKGGGDALLEEANKKNEELQTELNAMKLKLSGADEAMKMSKELLRASEAAAGDWQQKAEGLEGDLAKAVAEREEMSAVNEKASTDLTEALTELGVVLDKNLTLSQQIAKLAEQAKEGEEARTQRDELRGQVDALKSRLDTLEAERQELTQKMQMQVDSLLQEKNALQSELNEMKAAGAAGGAALTKEKERVADLEREQARLLAEAAANAEAYRKLEEELEKAKELAGSGGKKLEEEQAKNATLERTINHTMRTLEQGMHRLNLPKRDRGETLDQRVAALVENCETVMSTLEKAFADLNMTLKENETLEQKVKSLIEEVERGREEIIALKFQAGTLQQKLSKLQEEMAEIESQSGGASRQAAQMKVEMATCAEKIAAALRAASGQKENKEAPKPALTPQVNLIIRKYNDLVQQLEEMQATLNKSQEAMEKLQGALGDLSSVKSGMKEEAKKERQILVNSALESMRHLRTHLVSALIGLREVASSMPETALEISPTRQRIVLERPWAGETSRSSPLMRKVSMDDVHNGQRLVVTFELPTIDAMGLGRPRPHRDPRIFKGLSYETQLSPSRTPGKLRREVERSQDRPLTSPHSARPSLPAGQLARGANVLPAMADLTRPPPLGMQESAMSSQR